MIGEALMGDRPRHRALRSLIPSLFLLAVVSFGLLAGPAMQPAYAADCPGHPDAIGTSRTLVVDPRQHPRIGTMQYAQTLPLEDHEVVLTFDDGPLPHNTNPVLDTLASQCVKATFFLIGEMAHAYPETARKLIEAGHSVGTHSQTHPLTFNKMSVDQAKQQVDDGIASVTAALGDPAKLSPFFRIPGLLRAEAVEGYLESQGIQTWSADFPADDWRHISSSRVYELAIRRIEAKGKGVLLLHDIQPRTVAALPRILQTLKAGGYRIVHVIAATAEQPATPTEPQQWLLHPPTEDVATSHWPKIPNFVFASADTLPIPSMSDLDGHTQQMAAVDAPLKTRVHGIPLPREAPWPRDIMLPPENAATSLPVPAESLFEMRDRPHVASAAASPMLPPEVKDAAKSRSRGGKRVAASRATARGATAHAHRGGLKHLVQVKKRNV